MESTYTLRTVHNDDTPDTLVMKGEPLDKVLEKVEEIIQESHGTVGVYIQKEGN